MTKVCHFSSVHKADDARVLHKECRTLAAAGYEVTLIARPADVESDYVNVIQLAPSGVRLARMLLGAWRVYRTAQEQDVDVYHFHDPELLPYGLLLKKSKKTVVVYDSHECYPEFILMKDWLPRPLRRFVAWIFEHFENYVTKRLDLVVAATPHIEERFDGIAARTVTINNYPLTKEFSEYSADLQNCRDGICYVGAISQVRGVLYMLDALDLIDPGIRFYLAGTFANSSIESSMRTHRNWGRVEFLGQVNRAKVAQIYSKSFAGLVTLLPAPNHIYAKPVKMYEYMTAGVPVISSNFQLWREVVEAGDCGLCVDPASPVEIARAVNRIHADEALRDRFSENGRQLVDEKYSWDVEGRRLVSAYETALDAG